MIGLMALTDSTAEIRVYLRKCSGEIQDIG